MKRLLPFALIVAGCAGQEAARRRYEPILAEHRAAADGQDASETRRRILDEVKAKPAWGVRDCIELAYLYNADLQSRGEAYYQSVLSRDRAVALALPSVALRATGFRQQDIGRDPPDRYEEYLRVKVPIFSGLRDIHGVGAANDLIDASGDALRQEKSSIALDVAEAFFEILKFERTEATLRQSLETQRQREKEMTDRVAAGVARKTELLLVQSQLAATEAAANRATNDLAVAKERLAVLLNTAVDRPLADDGEDPAPPDLDALRAMAFGSRSDLAALDGQRRAAEEGVDGELASWLPTLALTGNLYAQRDDPLPPIDWDVLVEAEINIFEGGGARARLGVAKSALRQAELSIVSKRLEIGLEVKREYYGWLSLKENVASFAKEVEVADENHRLLLEEYRQRLATNLEVQVAQDTLLSAQLDLDRAQLDKRIAFYRLMFVSGQLR